MRAVRLGWMISALVMCGVSAMALGGCLRTPGYHCASADQCTLDGVAGRCEPGGYCSSSDGSCTSGFRWATTAPSAGTCVDEPTPMPDAMPDAPIDAPIAATVNECLVQPKLAASASTCTSQVCAIDARCCTHEWSDTCVHLTETTCGKSCSGRLATIGDGLVRVQAWNITGFTTIWSHAVDAGDVYASVAWGDYDGDLDPDLVTCVEHGKATIWNNGDGSCGERFCEAFSVAITGCQNVDWIDLDHDGDLDVATGGEYIGHFWINDNGLFGTTTEDLFHGAIDTDMDWADLDGDGYLDLALAQYNYPATVERVTGGAAPSKVAFAPLWSDEATGGSLGHGRVVFGDVDGDGVLDLLSGGKNVFTQVWRNTSTTGGFSSAALPYFTTTKYGGTAATLADADEDGDLDIIQANLGGHVVVTANKHAQGSDAFTETEYWQSTDSLGDSRIAVGDVDGDGHLDIVVGVVPLTPTAATSVYLARPGVPWKFGDATDKANAVDPDHLIVKDLALGPAW